MAGKKEMIACRINTVTPGGYCTFDRGAGKIFGTAVSQQEVLVVKPAHQGPDFVALMSPDDHALMDGEE